MRWKKHASCLEGEDLQCRSSQVKLCRFYLRACVMEINIILDNLSYSSQNIK